MSERGVFAVDRGIWEHPAFAREPFTQREAWLWLVSEAAYKPRSKRADGKTITLERGQLCHSIRFMADAWQWSKSRVDRFIDMLENRDMLRSDRGTRTPILTVCNYDEYQRVALPDRDKSGTTVGTTAGQERDKLENIENTKDSLLFEIEPQQARVAPIAKPSRPGKDETFERFRAAYPKRDGGNPKEPARKKFEAATKSGIDPEAIIRGALAFAAAEQKRGNVGTRFIPHAATWLNERRWEDFQAASAAAKPADEAASWRLVVENWRRDPSTWVSHAWGPAPGEPGCRVPAPVLGALHAAAGAAA